SQEFYPQYYLIRSLPKTKGQPEQIEKGKISFDLPKELVDQSTYSFKLKLKNQGQGFWYSGDYQLQVDYQLGQEKTEILFDNLDEIAPNQEKEISFYLKTKDQGKVKLMFSFLKNGKKILESESWQFDILALPSLKFEVNYWPWGKGEGEVEVQIFDWQERLVFKTKANLKEGIGRIEKIKNITLNDLYRIVILKKGYLPRQYYYVFHPEENEIKFKKLLPFDLNADGQFNFQDFFWWMK
ncbi:MAG: hypothetical protein ACPLRN_02455, partial [Microgenomates group bacterium]